MKSLVLFALCATLLLACNNTTAPTAATPEVEEVETISMVIPDDERCIEFIMASDDKPVLAAYKPLRAYAVDETPVVELSEDAEVLLPDKPVQQFTVQPRKDQTIRCAEGTVIRVYPNTFVYAASKTPVTEPVQLEVKEFYDKADIVLAHLSTWSNGDVLETGGMLHLTASAGDQPCEIAQGKFMDVSFPTQKKNEGMQLFMGQRTSDNQMNWNVVPNSYDRNEIVTIPDVLPSFIDGEKGFEKFINVNLMNEGYKSFKKENQKGVISFIVDTTGKVINPKSKYCSNTSFCRAVRKVIKDQVLFNPAMRNGQKVNTVMTIPIDYVSYNRAYANRNYGKSKGYTSSAEPIVLDMSDDMKPYLLRIQNLGWINCDRFWNIPENEKTDVYVKASIPQTYQMSLVFHNYESVLSGTSRLGGYSFKSIPQGEPVTLIALKRKGKELYMAIKNGSTDDKDWQNLEYELVEADKIKEKINASLVTI